MPLRSEHFCQSWCVSRALNSFWTIKLAGKNNKFGLQRPHTVSRILCRSLTNPLKTWTCAHSSTCWPSRPVWPLPHPSRTPREKGSDKATEGKGRLRRCFSNVGEQDWCGCSGSSMFLLVKECPPTCGMNLSRCYGSVFTPKTKMEDVMVSQVVATAPP